MTRSKSYHQKKCKMNDMHTKIIKNAFFITGVCSFRHVSIKILVFKKAGTIQLSYHYYSFERRKNKWIVFQNQVNTKIMSTIEVLGLKNRSKFWIIRQKQHSQITVHRQKARWADLICGY